MGKRIDDKKLQSLVDVAEKHGWLAGKIGAQIQLMQREKSGKKRGKILNNICKLMKGQETFSKKTQKELEDYLEGDFGNGSTFAGLLPLLEKNAYSFLEEQAFKAAENPEKISPFLQKNMPFLLSIFHCTLTNFENAIETNLQKDFRIVFGNDFSPKLKGSFKKIFVENKETVSGIIRWLIAKQKEKYWSTLAKINWEEVLELLRSEMYSLEGEKRIKKLIETYCRIIKRQKKDQMQKRFIWGSFYRELKIELHNQRMHDPIDYIQKLSFDEKKINDDWLRIKNKVIEEMKQDAYLQ